MSIAMIDQCYADGVLYMLGKALPIFIIAFLTQALLISIIHADLYASIVKYELKALAVSDNGTGVVIPMEIIVRRPGSGKLYYDKRVIGEDTALSIKLSLLYASIISGVDHREYDYYVNAKSPYMIKGVSATLLFTLAFTSILSNKTIPSDISATGVLGPGGVIGPVLRIDAKLRAAEKGGLIGVIARAALPINSSTYIPAYTVIDAYAKYSTNWYIQPVYGDTYDHLSELYAGLPEISSAFHQFSASSSDVLSMIGDNWRDEYYDKSLRYLHLAGLFYKKGYHYTASSLGFMSVYNAYISLLNYLYETDRTLYNETCDKIFNEALHLVNYVKTMLNTVFDKYRGKGWIPTIVLDSLITTKSRVIDAEIILNNLVNYEASTSPILFNSLLSYSYGRALTAVSWVNITLRLVERDDHAWRVNIDDLYAIMPYIEDFVNILLEYCEQSFNVIFVMPRSSDINHEEIDPIRRYVDIVANFLAFTKSFYSINEIQAMFTNGYETSDLVKLSSWLRGSLSYISPDTNAFLSSLLLLELIGNYIELDEIRKEDLISMIYQEYAKLFLYMALKLSIHVDKEMYTTSPYTLVHTVLAISVIYCIIGAFLVSISLKTTLRRHDV
ncbi:MAG: hypothetical protein QXU13_04330 [Desulfurococcaceae archaeon]